MGLIVGLAALMFLIMMLLSYAIIIHKMQQLMQHRRRALQELVGLDAGAPGADQKLRSAFNIFDRDRSGTIDRRELYLLLQSVNPKLSKKELREMVDELGIIEDIGLDDFLEQMKIWASAAKAKDKERSNRRARSASMMGFLKWESQPSSSRSPGGVEVEIQLTKLESGTYSNPQTPSQQGGA